MKKELFLKLLKDSGSEIGSLYFSLFSLKSKEDLEKELDYLKNLSEGKNEYFKEYGKENWFYIWHKSIRQCDYFDNCFQRRENKDEAIDGHLDSILWNTVHLDKDGLLAKTFLRVFLEESFNKNFSHETPFETE